MRSSNCHRRAALIGLGRKQYEAKVEIGKLKVRAEDAKKHEAEHVMLRAENKRLRRSKEAAERERKVSRSRPASVAEGLVKLGKDTMLGKHKHTKARAIVDNLEAAYGEAGTAALESKAEELLKERYGVTFAGVARLVGKRKNR